MVDVLWRDLVGPFVAAAVTVLVRWLRWLRAAGPKGPTSLLEVIKQQAAVTASNPVVPRLLAFLWLLVALIVEDPTARLGCVVCLTCCRGVPVREVVAGLVLALARQAVSGGAALQFAWVPWLLLLCFLLEDPAAAEGGSKRPVLPTDPMPSVARTPSGIVKRHPNWAPPRERETKVYQNVFNCQDQLLAVYSCAVSLKVLHHGQLYISADYISFQGLTLGGAYNLQFRVPVQDVGEIRRGVTRDTATLMLKTSAEMKLTTKSRKGQSTKAIEIVGCEAGLSVVAALLAHYSQPIEEEEEEEEEERSERGRDVVAQETLKAFSDGEPFRSVLEAHLPRLQTHVLEEDLSEADWKEGHFLVSYLTKIGVSDIKPAPWIDADTAASETPSSKSALTVIRIREVKMVSTVPPAPMCPKTTKVTATYCLTTTGKLTGENTVTLMSSKTSHDVPFGDRFIVQEKFELLPTPNGLGLDLKVSGRVVFLQSCGMLQSRIRSSTMTVLSANAEALVAELRSKESPGPKSPGSPLRESILEEDEAFRTERVWEVQRRATVWSTVWHAPFLPHERTKKGYRWLDEAYQPHSLRSHAPREELAAATRPPLESPRGWEPLGEWKVAKSDAGDRDGWQYAVDFYLVDMLWGKNPVGLSVRRRLWTRRFGWAKQGGDQ